MTILLLRFTSYRLKHFSNYLTIQQLSFATMASKSKDDKNQFQLSNNRFITVSEFRHKMRVDIREYYLNDDGDRKPGKKGISLSPQEWQQLKDLMPKIDAAIGQSESSSDDSSD